MSATATLTTPLRLIDTRRARGKHRAPRLPVLARRAAAAYVLLRVEVWTVTAAAGAVLWAAHGVHL